MKINRRKLLSLIGVSPAILAGSSPALAEPAKKAKPAAGPAKIETVTAGQSTADRRRQIDGR